MVKLNNVVENLTDSVIARTFDSESFVPGSRHTLGHGAYAMLMIFNRDGTAVQHCYGFLIAGETRVSPGEIQYQQGLTSMGLQTS